ncbi:efflux RND transporter periplasmic adaptor subunit [Hellea balneolensis]|uniref:efflux RND transporter periplasmic adaptor subunit n=1 Tax=Hellea balneolensis TaxID=287478 RepID=UPI000415F975|nr:efflux RND transporter periplasmic adaptor subunit [Hellea balneolensis]
MKINRSYLFAAGAVLAIALWFFYNSAIKEDVSQAPAPKIEQKTAMPTVVVEYRDAEDHQNSFKLFGRTEANREVDVKAETAGLVIATPVTEGRRIKRGTTLCRQDVDARQANLDQARANLDARKLDYQSSKTLVEKGYRSSVQLKSLQAAVDGANAAVKQAQIELDNVNMRAPFSGIFDSQIAEVGDYLLPGQPCGKLIEMDPLIVSVELTESQVGKISIGQEANVELATGQTINGKIRFIEANAKASTRTFRTEIEVPNADYALKGGVTATVAIRAGTVKAQHVPSKILTLDSDGTIGVRHLTEDNRVEFSTVSQIDEDSKGIWVTGLPDSTRIIVQGQDFVSNGTEVEPDVADYSGATE